MQKTSRSVWRAHITLSTKLRLYNTCVLPVVLYTSECWAPTKADLARLDALGQWCLTGHHLAGPHHEQRSRPALTNRLSVRPYVKADWQSSAMYRECHLQWTHTEPPTNTCLLIGEDDPADPDRPGFQLYVVICDNLALNWTTFHSLLLTMHCGGE